MSLNRQLANISSSGGLISNEFLLSIKNPDSAHPLVKIESFFKPGDQVPSSKEFAENLNKTFKDLLERWDDISLRYSTFDVSEARNKWILPLLRALGFDPLYNKEDIVIGKDTRLKFKLSHRGWCSPSAPYIQTVPPAQDLDTKAEKEKRSPHDMMQTYLNVQKDCLWGIVTNGIVLRVLREFYHTYTEGYVEFDLENIFRERSFKDFLALYRIVHSSRFIPDNEGICPLEHFYKESVAAGVKIGESLRDNVKTAIEMLGNGFLTQELTEKLISDEEFCKSYYSELLIIVYRILFLLFAEQRGMLPSRDSLYAEEYSITRLRETAERRLSRDAHQDIWEGLKVTFNMIKQGCPELKVFGYNGSLFDDLELKIIGNLQCRNEELLKAIKCLTIFEKGKVLQRINYLDLGVEEIGSIYENLLEFFPRVLPHTDKIDDIEIPARTFFLDPRGTTRKTTGSYYTNPRLIDQLIKSALKPVTEEKILKAKDKEQAILSIKVCDPACGSAAFLITATNYLGLALAKCRIGSEYPPDKEIRKAKRDVLQHCIYAVDLNPMAVELAKVSLWINACVEDMPLNFLDHHIKCGNSLIGTTPELLKNGVPDEAFATIEGDDKEFAKTVNKKNNLERNQRLMEEFEHESKEERVLASDYEKLSEITETTSKDVEYKKAEYVKIQGSFEWLHEKTVADTWCAAFFWPLTLDKAQPPTESVLRIIRKDMKGDRVDTKILAKITELTKEFRFFHWHLEFPDVFSGDNPGFDCIVGNPPWEKLTALEREFFSHIPEISDEKRSNIRKQRIEALKESDPILYDSWLKKKEADNRIHKFTRNSGRFPFTAVGELNTYPLFVELGINIQNSYGKTGMIIKTGMLSSPTWSNFTEHLIQTNAIESVYDFRNWRGWFPTIGFHERFTLLTLRGKKSAETKLLLCYYIDDVEEIYDPEKIFDLKAEDIIKLNPITKSLPELKGQRDKEILLKIYDCFPVISDVISGWKIRYSTGIHLTGQADLLKTKEELEDDGYYLDDFSIFNKNNSRYYPLLEGKFIQQYNHRFSSFEGIPRENRFGIKPGTYSPNNEQKKNPKYHIIPRYWISEEDLNEDFKKRGVNHRWEICTRDITNVISNTRTVMACINSNVCYYYKTANYIIEMDNIKEKNMQAILLLSLFNSIPFDYLTRQKFFGSNLTKTIVYQIAVPQYEILKKYYNLIFPKVLELSYTSYSLKRFAEDMQYYEEPFIWDEERRFLLKCELDAIFLKVYKFTKEDIEHIFETFSILKTKDIEKYGYYRTKEECLKAYDNIFI